MPEAATDGPTGFLVFGFRRLRQRHVSDEPSLTGTPITRLRTRAFRARLMRENNGRFNAFRTGSFTL